MAFNFPWTNFHELNLDWFLSKFKQFTNNFLGTTATAESVPYNAQPSVTVTGGDLDDDTDIVDPFTFHFKIPQGMGILSATQYYNVSNTSTEPVSGWTVSQPVVNPGQYLWIRLTIIFQNGNGQSFTYYIKSPDLTMDLVPTENSDNPVTSGGLYDVFQSYADRIMQDEHNLAFVESSSTASKDYIRNDYFLNENNDLCRITATVAEGATLIENTNYVVINNDGGLASTFDVEVDNDPLNAFATGFSIDGGNIVLIRCGKMRILSGSISAQGATSSNTVIATLKNTSDYPVADVFANTGNGGSGSLALHLDDTGELKTYGTASSSRTYQAFSIVYFV